MNKFTVSRRGLLSAGVAASAASLASSVFAQEKKTSLVPDKWDLTTEVLVVGSGGAGLAAAVSAAQAGAKVTVIEKLAFIGGNTMISSGYFNAVDPERQKKQGIEDSIEKHIEQTLAGGDGRADPELVRILCSNALGSLHWLESMGLKFRPDVMQVYGALWPRSHLATEPKGTGFIRVLSTKAKELGVDILTNTKLVKIIREQFDEGRALGVLAEQKGKPFYIRATKGIVLAAGGFAANPRLRAIHDPRMLTLTTTNNQACSTGEVMLAANEVGAYLMGLDYIQCIPGGVPGEKHAPNLFTHVDRFLFVNLDGKRFIKEDARRDVLRDAMLDQPKAIAWTIVDADGFEQQKNSKGPENEAALKAGTLYYADSIEDLAKKIGVPSDNLKEAVDTYNKAVDTKKDPLGRAEGVLVNKIIKAPFYAGRVTMKRHHTMGGVIINKDAQVIDRRGNVIPGLYAAGEVTGGIHGTNRVGGNAMADIFTYGRIAGVNAAKNPA